MKEEVILKFNFTVHYNYSEQITFLDAAFIRKSENPDPLSLRAFKPFSLYVPNGGSFHFENLLSMPPEKKEVMRAALVVFENLKPKAFAEKISFVFQKK